MIRIIGIVGLFGLMWTPIAQADPCADYCDYLCRHHRKDLVAQDLYFKRVGSELRIFMKVKNQGQETLNSSQSFKTFRAYVSGIGARSQGMTASMPSGDVKYFFLGTTHARRYRHCQTVRTRIDYDKSIGQWGCQVFNNDTKTMQIRDMDRGACRGR